MPLQTKAPVKLLSKRGVLQDLYANVPASNKVNTGTAVSWSNNVNTAAVYAPTEFYGCTLVVVVNGNVVMIGHFAQEKPGNVVCKEDSASVKSMISKLETAEAEVDLDDVAGTQAWIIYSDDTGKTSAGYEAIFSNLNDEDKLNIPESNISPIPYRRGGGGGNFDKLVVQWAPNSDNSGATLNVYIRSNNPSFTGTYDCNGNAVAAGTHRLMARASSVCSLTSSSDAAPTSTAFSTLSLTNPTTAAASTETLTVIPIPATGTPLCSYVAPEPPVINEAFCSCAGKSHGLSTVPGTAVPVSSSCGYTQLPSSTVSGLDSDPATTDIGACEVCTPYAENGSDCTSIPNCTPTAAPMAASTA